MYFILNKNSYKKFKTPKFKEVLNGKSMEHYKNNVNYEIFHEIMISILDANAPLKKKHLKANHATFVTKKLPKAVMKRIKLRNA